MFISSRSSHDFSLQSQQDLIIPSISSALKGQNALRYLGSVTWNLNEIRNEV